jgi:RHS repeat-associated protein
VTDDYDVTETSIYDPTTCDITTSWSGSFVSSDEGTWTIDSSGVWSGLPGSETGAEQELDAGEYGSVYWYGTYTASTNCTSTVYETTFSGSATDILGSYDSATYNEDIITTLSHPFTADDTAAMLRTSLIASSFPSMLTNGVSPAVTTVSPDLSTGTGNKTEYRWHLKNTELNVNYLLKWQEISAYTNGTSSVRNVQEELVGTGDPANAVYGSLHVIQAPSMPGITTVTVPTVSVESPIIPGEAAGIAGAAGSQGCSACGSSGAAGSKGDDTGPQLAVSMGGAQYGQSAGRLVFSSSVPDPSLYTPTALQFTAWTRSDVTVITNSDGSLRQVVAPEALADIPVPANSNGYIINFYYPNQVGSLVSNVYALSGSPFTTWAITNTNTANFNQIQISESSAAYGLIKQSSYTYSTNTGTWTMLSLGNLVQENISVTSLSSNVSQIVDSLQSPSGPIVDQVAKTYETFYWSQSTNVGLTQVATGSNSAPEVTSYTYWDPATFSAGSLVLPQFITHADGSWQLFASYNSSGFPLTVYSSYGDVGTNNYSNARETIYDYSTNPVSGSGDIGVFNTNVPRKTTVLINGQIVALSYTAFPSAGERLDVQCLATNAAWNSTGNLVTTSYFYTSGPNQFALESVIRPDGTMTTYNYLTNATGSYRTNITTTGQPDSTDSYIVDGVSNQTVVSLAGYPASSTSWDVKSGIIVFQDIYTNVDGYGRPQWDIHLDGTTNQTYYACCGVDSTTDADALVDQYDYDSNHRLTGHTRVYGAISISSENMLDAAGRSIEAFRVGSDNTTNIMAQTAYDASGEILSKINALGGTNTYGRSTNATTKGLIVTRTNPDGGTVTNVYYADGTLKTNIGTAIAGKAYGYGVGSDYNGNQCTTVTVTDLNTDGTLSSQWIETFMDMAGRITEVLYAAASGSPMSLRYYNGLGQLTKQVDPDGVTTMYIYNPKGERAITALKEDTSSSITWTGDRITFTSNYVAAAHGTNVLRTDTYVWDNSSTNDSLLSRTETSTGGLQQWNTIWSSGTAVINSSQTVYSSGGNRMRTNTAPDSSYSVDAYVYGRLASTTKYDSTGAQIGQTTNGYDAHGRQNTITDARNGTTTLTFMNDDQVSTVTTPSPSEETVNYYDTSERLIGTKQPDGTYTTNLLNPTGLPWQSYGSREYPVGNGYDGQERMTTMTNWTSFLASAGARVTTWNYDPYRGWLSSKVYADGKGTTYGYSSAGRLETRSWARGTNTAYGYTAGGDLALISYNDGITPAITNGYDHLGHKTVITNGSAVTTLVYNDPGLLQIETNSGGPLSGWSLTNGYDSFMRRTKMAVLSNGTPVWTVNYTYDNASRLATASDGTNTATYSYLANSALVGQIGFSHSGITNMITSRGYDNLNRLTSISSVNGSSVVVDSHGYGYNSANQRVSMTNADGSYWIYGYDSLGQVTSAVKYWSDGTPAAGEQFGNTFDNIGNRISSQMGGNANGLGLRNASYAVNNLNQYTSRTVPGAVDIIGSATNTSSVTVNGILAYRHGSYYRAELPINNAGSAVWQSVTNLAVLGAATNTDATVTGSLFLPQNPEDFTYDKDGNLTSDGRFTNTWDAENRLLGMTNIANIAPPGKYALSFTYDYMGRRIQKIVYTNNGSAWVPSYTNKFIYDGWNVVAILDGGNNLISSFVSGSDLSGSLQGAGGVGGLISITVYTGANSGTYFYCYDANGNVTALANVANGSVAAQYEYGPFGEVIRATGLLVKSNPFRFSTKCEDDESGLLYYGYRYYDPGTGRWPSRDPIDELGSVPSRLYAAFSSYLPDAMLLTGTTGYNDFGVNDVIWHGTLFGDDDGDNSYLFSENDSLSKIDTVGTGLFCNCGSLRPVAPAVNGTKSGQRITTISKTLCFASTVNLWKLGPITCAKCFMVSPCVGNADWIWWHGLSASGNGRSWNWHLLSFKVSGRCLP